MKRDKYKITDKYVLFSGSFLSNWWPCYNGIKLMDWYCGERSRIVRVPSSEHIYMYFKAIHFNDKETALKILEATSVEDAKNLGRSVKGFDEKEWNEVSYVYMLNAVSNKFHQCDQERIWLCSPEFWGKKFVEARQQDSIWGIGLDWRDPLAEDEKNWKGENRLGEILTLVRDRLLEEQKMQLALF